jgi:hypothetical protein
MQKKTLQDEFITEGVACLSDKPMERKRYPIHLLCSSQPLGMTFSCHARLKTASRTQGVHITPDYVTAINYSQKGINNK